MASKKQNGHRHIKTCTLYRFKGKAPIMGEVLAAIGDQPDDFREIAGKGGPARSTMRGWKPDGKTSLATFRTMENALRARGKRFVIGDL